MVDEHTLAFGLDRRVHHRVGGGGPRGLEGGVGGDEFGELVADAAKAHEVRVVVFAACAFALRDDGGDGRERTRQIGHRGDTGQWCQRRIDLQ